MSKRLVAIDYDGTWSEAPKFFADFGKTLRDGGWTVVVLTGNPNAEKELEDDSKSYDQIFVADHDSLDEHVTAASKAQWADQHKADLVIDNNVTNCLAISQYTDAALFFAKQDPNVKAKKAEKASATMLPGYQVGIASLEAHRRSTTDTAA